MKDAATLVGFLIVGGVAFFTGQTLQNVTGKASGPVGVMVGAGGAAVGAAGAAYAMGKALK